MATSSRSSFTVVSVFSGCGGSSLGYQLAGGKVRLAVEWDDNAVATYRMNFPNTPIYHGDICKLSMPKCCELSGIEPGELDILDSSPPCQGFSTAGKRNFNDDRNQLFREFVRLLRGLRPRVFVMENVSGMVKGKMRLIFAECLQELKASGYRVKARVLNAMYFNVPQNRQRLIFVGVRKDLRIEPVYPKAQRHPMTVKQAIGDLEYNFPEEHNCHRPHIYEQWQTGYNPRNGRAGLRVVRPGAYVGSFNSCRLEPNKPAATLIKAHKHWHYSQFRQLRCIEASRLASFPDSFQWRVDWAKRIGNSVPPNFMRAIASHIRDEILGKAIGANLAA